MIIKKGIAFKSYTNLKDKVFIGNPASIVILQENDDLFDTKLLSRVAIKEKQPITCFTKQKKLQNEFDVRFFTPSGDEVNICGHGTIVAGKILKEHFYINENKIIFYLNKDLCIGEMLNNDCTETIFINNDNCSIQLVKIPYDKSKINQTELRSIKKIMEILNLKENNIEDCIKSNEYHDFILILKDNQKLRNLDPNFTAITPFCNNLNCRSVSFSSRSDLNGFDYETRVFAPHIGVNEDIVCASINSTIADYWSRKLNKTILNVLYPYHWNDGACGGVQSVEVFDYFILLEQFLFFTDLQ